MKKPTFILNNQCLRNNDAIEVKITLKNNMLLKVIALVVCLLCVLSAAACNSSVELSDAPNGSSKNNIVFVLMSDMDNNYSKYYA